MAHELSRSQGVVEMMYAGTTPWHGLGNCVGDDVVTPTEALIAAHLNWAVEQKPVFFCNSQGRYTEVPDQFVNYRADTEVPLGIVGNKYKVLQNRDAFSFLDDAFGEGYAKVHTAGALQGGRRVWIAAKIDGAFQVGPDEIAPYFLMSNRHDGGGALWFLTTPVRVVCANTLAMAMQSSMTGQRMAIRHSSGMESNMTAALEVLGVVRKKVEAFCGDGEALLRVPMTGEAMTSYWNALFPGLSSTSGNAAVTRRNQLIGMIRTVEQSRPNLQASGVRGTLWAAFNAVTDYVDHEADYDSAESRMESAIFGARADLKTRAFTSAKLLAGVN